MSQGGNEMTDSTIPKADEAEAKRRAEWLHKHKAHKDWIILSVSEVAVIRDELLILERERDEAREKFDLEAVENMLAINKLCNQRDEAIEKHRFAVIHWQIGMAKMQRERDDALNQIQGWENKWKVAVDMAAIAENKVSNLEGQLDLAMKVIKRLEANQP